MFGMNPYLMSTVYGSGGSAYRSPYSSPNNTGEGTSFTWNEDERRKARGAAMMQLGIGLLSGAGSGKIAEGLASGLQGFSQTMVDARERERARQRQESLDAMAREEHGSSMETSRLNRSVVQGQQENIEEDRQRADQQRQRRAASIPNWVRDIEAELGPDSPEAKRARNYAMLGEDVDLERLERLHMEAVDQSPAGAARRASRFQEETALGIGRAQKTNEHGYGPIADASRANAQLALDRRRTAYYGQQVNEQGRRTSLWANPGQFADDVASETERLMSDWLASQPKPGDKPRRELGVDANGKPVIKMSAGPPTPQEVADKRVELEMTAIANVRRRLQEGGGVEPGGSRPTMAPGEYVYKDGHMYRKTPQGLELVY